MLLQFDAVKFMQGPVTTTSPESDPLLADIETALDLYGLSATRFGYVTAGDPALVSKLRAGRRIKKIKLRERIQRFLSHLTESGELI